MDKKRKIIKEDGEIGSSDAAINLSTVGDYTYPVKLGMFKRFDTKKKKKKRKKKLKESYEIFIDKYLGDFN